MDKSTNVLTKTCAACGQKKPLSAFMQLAGSQGRTYGNICSTCRKAEADKIDKPKEPEESIIPKLQLKIDSKAKVFEAVAKRERQAFIQERDEKERFKQQELQTTKAEKAQIIARSERKHRESLFDKQRAEPVKKGDAHKIVGGIEMAAEESKVTTHILSRGPTISSNSAVFRSYIAWLGKNSALGRLTLKALGDKESHNSMENSAEEDHKPSPHSPTSKK